MRILIADDHAIVRKGLAGVLLEEFPSAKIVEVGDAETLFKLVPGDEWDLIISDLSMPGRGGLEVLYEIKRNYPHIPVLILSIHPEGIYGPRVLRAGASGFLNKDAPPIELVKAIRWILQGRKYITPAIAEKLADRVSFIKESLPHELLSDREFDVMKLLASGESLVRIGELLSISPSTVSSFRNRILKKMGMRSNTDLARYCMENNFI
ncbi:MAG: response regulator transcription factor [Bacteroidetes bacterium]|nr:response regulator transcription factor [Bacteroidota bacterium]